MSFTGRVKSLFKSGDSVDSETNTEEKGVVLGEYTWEDYLQEYSSDTSDITPETIKETLTEAGRISSALNETVDKNTVDVQIEDEDAFFRTSTGKPTIVSRYDLEKAVAPEKKTHFVEMERYWVNKPFAFVVLFRSTRENEIKYYVIEPYLNMEEKRVSSFLSNKLEDTIKFADEATHGERTNPERAAHIEEKVYELLFRYGLIEETPFEKTSTTSNPESSPGSLREKLNRGDTSEVDDENTDSDTSGSDDDDNSGSLLSFGSSNEKQSIVDKLVEAEAIDAGTDDNTPTPKHIFLPPEAMPNVDGLSARPEETVINEGSTSLTDYQVIKLLYYLKRDAVSFGKIDPIKHDINVEDISCDGYNRRVWAYHTEHEQLISNIEHGEKTLDDFVVNLAQRSGQGISKREPQVDVTLPDGSRGQLTLGQEVSDHGTNYTIRQFKDVPFTPIDLINWKTFSAEQMAFLWLCIENHKSLIFAGGTASGKTTSLNAISLFIPSNTKIVSIEDTREVELPQQNWVASVTRASFSADGVGEVDEFALLEAALRQRPDYIVMGEIRGEEGRTLFQVMSTGHTTYTTFHADSVGEVIKRFTTDPINVSKTLFTALDLVSIQTATRVDGHKVRRNKTLTEINDYSSENDEINVNDVYQWNADTDEFEKTENSEVLNTIKFDRGWDDQKLEEEISKREVVLAYMIKERLNTYAEVAATFQAFINGPEVVLNLIANGLLEESLDNLREMESVGIDIDPDKEEMVPRPEPPDDILEWANTVLEDALDGVLEGRIGVEPEGKLSKLLEGSLSDHDDVEIMMPENDDGEQSEPTEDESSASETEQPAIEADADEETEGEGIGGFISSETKEPEDRVTPGDGDGPGTAVESEEDDEESSDEFAGFVTDGVDDEPKIGDEE